MHIFVQEVLGAHVKQTKLRLYLSGFQVLWSIMTYVRNSKCVGAHFFQTSALPCAFCKLSSLAVWVLIRTTSCSDIMHVVEVQPHFYFLRNHYNLFLYLKCFNIFQNEIVSYLLQSGKFVLCDRDLGRAVLMFAIYFIVNF